MNLKIISILLMINILSVKAKPSDIEEIYVTTTLYSCICYLLIALIAKLCIIIYKKYIKYYLSRHSDKKHITSINSSEDSIPTLINRYENIKEIEKVLPVNLEPYISSKQWSEQIEYLNLYDQHRNQFFAFHPLIYPIVSALVKYYQYYKMNKDWDKYLLDKVNKNEDSYQINKLSTDFRPNNEPHGLNNICIILIIEEIICFILYYWLSKYMVKKNHKSFTTQFSQMNESLKNQSIPLVWVLDWKPPEYNLFGYSEQCYIELHNVEQDINNNNDIIIINS